MAFKRFVRSARATLVLAAALSIALCSCSRKKEEPKGEAESTPNVTIDSYARVPDVLLKRLDGTADRLSSYQGKIVVLNVWTTWNKDCKRQIVELNALHATLKGTPVVVLGVAMDSNGEAALRKFIATTPISYSVFYNGEEVIGKFGGVRKLPTTYVILRDGSVYEKVLGFHNERFFGNMLDEMKKMRM